VVTFKFKIQSSKLKKVQTAKPKSEGSVEAHNVIVIGDPIWALRFKLL